MIRDGAACCIGVVAALTICVILIVSEVLAR